MLKVGYQKKNRKNTKILKKSDEAIKIGELNRKEK